MTTLTEDTYALLLRRFAARLGIEASELARSRRKGPSHARQRLWRALHDGGVSQAQIARVAGFDQSSVNTAVRVAEADPSFCEDMQVWLMDAERRVVLTRRLGLLADQLKKVTQELLELE